MYAAPSSSLPFWDTICELYDPSEVAVVDGGDDPMNMATLYKFSACAQHVFSREGFVLSSESPHTREGVLLKEMKGKEIKNKAGEDGKGEKKKETQGQR